MEVKIHLRRSAEAVVGLQRAIRAALGGARPGMVGLLMNRWDRYGWSRDAGRPQEPV